METKRLTAKKAGIEEITSGKFVQKSGFESNYILTNLGRRISRARILGVVVSKFISQDNNYGTLTIDDGIETVRCKVFVNVKIFDSITSGDLVEVFAKIREYQGEIYLMPEIIRKREPDFESLRLMELKLIYERQVQNIKKINELKIKAGDLNELKIMAKEFMTEDEIEAVLEAEQQIQLVAEEKTEKTAEANEKILKLVETLDAGAGAEYQTVLEKSGLEESLLDSIINELLDKGILMEPKAGKLKRI